MTFLELRNCPRCGVSVLPTSEGLCPNCRRSVADATIVQMEISGTDSRPNECRSPEKAPDPVPPIGKMEGNKVSAHSDEIEQNGRCSRCGTIASRQRAVLCTASTRWGYDEDSRGDILGISKLSTPSVVRRATYETIVDDKKVWNVVLCADCLAKGYWDHLAHQIKGLSDTFKFSGIISVAILPILVLSVTLSWAAEVGTILLLVFLGFGVVSVIAGVDILTTKRELKKVEALAVLPEKPKYIDGAFEGEAERIMKSMEAGHTDFYGSFELPRFSTEAREGRIRGISFRSISSITDEMHEPKV